MFSARTSSSCDLWDCFGRGKPLKKHSRTDKDFHTQKPMYKKIITFPFPQVHSFNPITLRMAKTAENNKNKKSVKFQGDMLNFCNFIQVFIFTTNHHLKYHKCLSS